jgi:hypothetical protein
MAHRLAIELASGITARLNTRADCLVNVVITAGRGLHQRVVYSACFPIERFTKRAPGLFIDNAFVELTDAEGAAVFGFLTLAGWKA